jgi:hypothetical protein
MMSTKIEIRLSIKLNQRKTQLLVGPLTHISTKQQEILTHLTTILQPEHTLTEGCKLLGQAIGTSTHATNCMKQQATKCRTAASRITTRLLNRQIISSIYRCCAPHRRRRTQHTQQKRQPPTPTKWTTPFLNAIKTTDSFFLRFITDTNENNLPPHASLIATIPAKDGGLLGHSRHHPQRAALDAFAVPTARTIKYAFQGPQIGSNPVMQTKLAADHRCPFETLTTHTAPNNPWKHIGSMAHTINTQITRNETDTPCADISKAQTQQRFCQTMTTAELLTQTPLIPKEMSPFPPSSPSPLTSIALHNLPRRSEPSNQLNNESFTPLMQRKLRLPILHQPGKCMCGTTFDKHGDHALGCQRTSSQNCTTRRHHKDISNHTTTIAHTACDTVVEPTGFIPGSPAKRPADIMICLSPPANQTNQPLPKLQLLDIAMPHPPSLTAPPHGLDERAPC